MRRLILTVSILSVQIGIGYTQLSSRDSAKVWFSVGRDYFNKGNMERAILNFHRALKYDSTYVDIYLHLAQAHLRLNQFDSAEVAYRKIAEIEPEDSRGWQGLGFMFGILKKDYEKGIEYYERAVKVDPKNKDAWFGLATMFDKAGRPEAADSTYRVALEKDPDNKAIIKSYGLFLAERKEYKRAIQYLEQVYDTSNPDQRVEDKLLDTYLTLGKDSTQLLEKALVFLDKKLKVDSTNGFLYLKRADVLSSLGKYKRSLSDYDRAAEILDHSPVPLLKKASLLVNKLGDYSGARISLQKALEYEMEDQVRAAALALLGDTYFQPAQSLRKEGDKLRKKGIEREARDRYAKAVELYDSAIEIYKRASKLRGTQWAEYASKQLKRAETLRKKAWRRSQGIE